MMGANIWFWLIYVIFGVFGLLGIGPSLAEVREPLRTLCAHTGAGGALR